MTAICRSYNGIGSTRFVAIFFFSFFSFGVGEYEVQKRIFVPKNSPIKPNRQPPQIKVQKSDCTPQKALGDPCLLTARGDSPAGFQGKSLPDQKERSGKQNRDFQPLP